MNSTKTLSAVEGLQNGNTTNEVIVQTVQLDLNMNEEKLCSEIHNSTSMVPTFFLDISTSTWSKAAARKMGIASLRSTTNLKESSAWKNLNSMEENIFITILTPEAIILHMIKDITNQYNYKSIVVIYDHTFSKTFELFYLSVSPTSLIQISEDAFRDYKIKNLKVRAIFWNSPTEQKVDSTFQELRQYGYSMTFFVIGSTKMLNQVLHHVSLVSYQ